jgi:hypothetical protein
MPQNDSSTNTIRALIVALGLTLAATGYLLYLLLREPSVTPIPQMRHSISAGNEFINNYKNNANAPRPIPETGWLVNSSELLPYVLHAEYVHISLARVTPGDTGVTLVISGVTKQYNHWFPVGIINGDTRPQPYILETVHPCPLCRDLINDANSAVGASENLSTEPDAVKIQP